MSLWGVFRRIKFPHLVLDVLAFGFSCYLALWLRRGWEGSEPILISIPFRHAALLMVAVETVVFILFHVYDIIWRYVSFSDVMRIAAAIVVSGLTNFALTRYTAPYLTHYFFFINAFSTAFFIYGMRMSRRWVYELLANLESDAPGRRTLIYGAGTDGRLLSQFFTSNPKHGFLPVGFVDDDDEKVGRSIGGLRIFGSGTELEKVLAVTRAQELIVAIRNPGGVRLRNILEACRARGIKPNMMGDWNNISPSSKQIEPVRKIELSDLLNRSVRKPDLHLTRKLLEGRRILITGAGGTIGSELARQIMALRPSKLLLLDHSEASLYQIDQELRPLSSSTSPVTPLLADIKDRETLERTFEVYRPEIVFHAAAYKHVHLVENNSCPSILNNILGTKNLLELSESFDVQNFILISTDKAVNPVGVMGATKRVCELMVAQAGAALGRNYCAVRFGNVLGSSGSLIPLLIKQIETNQPVTITHRDMTRYFMLIPEAVALVLRATTLAKPGDIAVLRMGEPVKIVDIARNLLTLMGRTEEDSPIVFTGMRPGEKLFEEMYIQGNEILTDDPDVLIVPRGDNAHGGLSIKRNVEEILDLARVNGQVSVAEIQRILGQSFAGKNPSISKLEPMPKLHLSH